MSEASRRRLSREAGTACFFWDGPWNIGVVKQSWPSFADRVGGAPIPTPTGKAPVRYDSASVTFWISKTSSVEADASSLMQQLATPQYYIGIAEGMDQPPLDLAAVGNAKVHPTCKQAIGHFESQVTPAPNPPARNPRWSTRSRR